LDDPEDPLETLNNLKMLKEMELFVACGTGCKPRPPHAQAACATGARSVAFTYNDPVIFLEYAVDVAAACREVGLQTVAVTAGYIGKLARPEFFAAMDAANIDLKAFTESFYKQLCTGSLDAVLDTLIYVKHETKTWLEITTLFIPGKNDSSVEVAALCEWVATRLGPDVPLHLTAFHPDWKMRDVPSTPPFHSQTCP
jgi:pyruvate formate lyase activating enzyme